MEASKKTNSIPAWDGAEKTCGRYLSKIEAQAQYYEMAEALDESEMQACPDKAAFALIPSTTTDANEKARRHLYKSNLKLMATLVMGQDSDLGMAMIEKTKTVDFPSGVAWMVLAAMRKKCKPCDATAEIQMEQEIEGLGFTLARKYYQDVIGVQARYNVQVTDTVIIKKMVRKVADPVYVQLIILHLAGTTHDLEQLCEQIDAIQSLTKVRSGIANARSESGKETALAGAEYQFKGKCSNCGEVGHKRKDCTKPKKSGGGGAGRGGHGGRGNGGGGRGGGSNKTCNSCGKKGHEEKDCWRKYPDKAPAWFKKDNETAGGAVEVMVAHVECDAVYCQHFEASGDHMAMCLSNCKKAAIEEKEEKEESRDATISFENGAMEMAKGEESGDVPSNPPERLKGFEMRQDGVQIREMQVDESMPNQADVFTRELTNFVSARL